MFIIIYSSTSIAHAKPPSGYLTPIGGGNIGMEENAAYRHMRNESGQHELPSGDSKTVYANI